MKPTLTSIRPFFIIASAFTAILLSSCQKSIDPSVVQQETLLKKSMHVKTVKHYQQRNLVANSAGYGALHVDPTMVNAWGLAFSSGGTAWVSSNAGHVSNVYDSIGNPAGINPVAIPGPTTSTGGTPTGQVFNGTTGFQIPVSAGSTTMTTARFIFVGDDGVLSAWAPTWGHSSYRVANNSATSSYTGLAIGSSGGNNYIYAANFIANGRIDVWNSSWQPVSMPFTDPNLPSGYAPFNIQAIGNQLYVMYAQIADGDEVKGIGLGIVDIYSTSGMFIQRFATGGTLNAPWGVAIAPASFVSDDADASPAILVGNFGDGKINAYRASDGKFIGQLSSSKNDPLVIDGLWAISFAPATSTINHNLLYFTAGPNDETAGLIGYLSKVNDDDD
ncbi:MAG: TIGR03118 family protein [Candidatus Dadabacteria bacterium]